MTMARHDLGRLLPEDGCDDQADARRGALARWTRVVAHNVNWRRSAGRRVVESPRLTPSSLAGEDRAGRFWTYTCINWLRTLPYVRAWAKNYRQGLVVIGVHTPEFAVERNVDNVRRAVKQMRIEYPVAIDNDYSIWRAFNNQYWPALYFVDARGSVRQHHSARAIRSVRETIQRLWPKRESPASASGHFRRSGVEGLPIGTI